MIKPDKSKQDSKKIQIKDMFNDISSRYDQINKMMTLNMDKNWRKIVYNLSMQDNPRKIIDIATGTGDIALCFANDDVEVIGIDNASMMLDLANKKAMETPNVKFQLEDAENMSFKDNTFDLITIAFGLRNVSDKKAVLESILSSLKPGGKLMILEFSRPTNEFFRELYDIFSFEVIPKIGEFVAQSEDSYRYLAESIRMHPTQEELKDLMESVGFSNCNFDDLTNGVVAIHSGKKGMVDA